MTSQPSWHEVATEDQVASDLPLSVSVGKRQIGIYLLNGRHYALDDLCPHEYALLSEGFVDGEEIECPLHGARFHIPTGSCTKAPADRDIACYEVKLERGRIFVKVG